MSDSPFEEARKCWDLLADDWRVQVGNDGDSNPVPSNRTGLLTQTATCRRTVMARTRAWFLVAGGMGLRSDAYHLTRPATGTPREVGRRHRSGHGTGLAGVGGLSTL